MATSMTSNRCSICRKRGVNDTCEGCQTFFCIKHFNEHQQRKTSVRYPLRTLRRCRGLPTRPLPSAKPTDGTRRSSASSIQFDRHVSIAHEELLEQIHQLKQTIKSSTDVFSQIDLWENAKIDKVHNAANRARGQVTQLLNCEREALAKQLENSTTEIDRRQAEDNFVENDVKHLRHQINRLQQSFEQLTRSNESKVIIVENDQIDWNQLIYAEKTQEPASPVHFDIAVNAKWTQNGITVAGGNGKGDALDQLCYPYGLYVDHHQTVVIADFANHRIVEWKRGAISGQVVAGENGQGNGNDQLNGPTDVLIDKATDSLIICDFGNRRVVRWPRRGGTSGETIIANIKCWGLTMDKDGFLYISDDEQQEVRRWRTGETRGTVVAGGNGPGPRLNQLYHPRCVFVDQDHSVYVSDWYNHRVMKWSEGAKEGIVVAGGQGQGNSLTQLSNPQGVVVDELGTVYVADHGNHRIMCWPARATQGIIAVDENSHKTLVKKPTNYMSLAFDPHGDLYVVDCNFHHVQKFTNDSGSHS